MLSVPSGTCDLHISCWQGGDTCQTTAAAVFMLFNYALWFSAKRGWSLSCPDLLSCQRVTCTTIPVLSAWHCVIPFLYVVATGFPGHAGGWHWSRNPCVFLFFLDGFCTWWQIITDSRQPKRNVSWCGVEMMALIHVNLFLETPKFQVPTSYSTNSSGYTWARSKKTPRHSFGSEMPVRTVSQKCSLPLWGRIFK